jgi:hypothetical protein
MSVTWNVKNYVSELYLHVMQILTEFKVYKFNKKGPASVPFYIICVVSGPSTYKMVNKTFGICFICIQDHSDCQKTASWAVLLLKPVHLFALTK